MPITGVIYMSSPGLKEMKAIETPASAPNSAARGVILRMIGATKPPAISTKLCINTHDGGGIRYPAKTPARGRDKGQADFVKLGDIRAATVAGHDAAVAAIIGFAHGGMHTNFGRHAAHDQILDAAVLQYRMQISRIK